MGKQTQEKQGCMSVYVYLQYLASALVLLDSLGLDLKRGPKKISKWCVPGVWVSTGFFLCRRALVILNQSKESPKGADRHQIIWELSVIITFWTHAHSYNALWQRVMRLI